MTDFATLVLGAKTTDLKTAGKELDTLAAKGGETEVKTTRAMAGVSKSFAAVAASAVALLSVGVIFRKVTSSIGRIDAADEAAASIDGTVNALRALELAAGEAGVAQGDLMVSLQSMNREIAKAAEEAGPAREALSKLGLQARDLAALDADERMATIADAVKRLGLTAGQATAVLQDLGVRSKEMSLALINGGSSIRQARKDIKDLGLELDQNTINGIARTNDALGRMGLASEALGNRLAVILAPSLEKMAEGFVNAMREGGTLRKILDGLGHVITGFVNVASLAINTLVGAFHALQTALDLPARAIRWLLDLGPTALQAQRAIDQLTLAMGSELQQANALLGTMGPGVTMTKSMAVEKLRQASAHLAAMDAMRQEQLALVQSTDEYKRLSNGILSTTQQLENLKFLQSSQGGGEFAPNAYRADMEAALAVLHQLVDEQQNLLGATASLSPEYLAAKENITRLEAALAAATGETVTIKGELVTADDIAARLSGTIGGIDFGAANAGASELVTKLGMSLQLANAVAGMGLSGNAEALMSDERGSQRGARTSAQSFLDTKTIDAANRSAAKYQETLLGLGKAGGGAGEKTSKAMKEAEKKLEDAKRAAEKLKEELERPVVNAVTSVSDAFGDFVANGLRNFEGFRDSVVGSFKNMISEMIAYALKNRILIGLGMGGGVTGAASAALGGAAPGGGLLGGLPGDGGILSTILGSMGSGTGLLGGAGSVLSGLMGGGLGGAGSALGAALGGATSGLGGMATALGALAVPLAAVAGIFSFMSSKTKVLDSGLTAMIGTGNALVKTFQTVQKSRFWGLSKKTKTTFTPAEKRTANPIISAVNSIQNAVRDAAKHLGFGGDVFKKFAFKIWVSSKDRTPEQTMEAFQQKLIGMGNKFALMVPGLAKLVRHGEGAAAAITRLAQELGAVNESFKALGFTLLDTSLKGAAAASKFVKAFGGLDNYARTIASYFDNFYNDQEKIVELRRRLQVGLQDAGIKGGIPASIQDFRALVDRLMASGQSGKAAKLIKLHELFIQLQTALGNTTESVKGLIEAVDPKNFATLFEFQKAQRRVADGYPLNGGPGEVVAYSAPVSQPQNTTQQAEQKQINQELQTSNQKMVALLTEIAKHVGFSRNTLSLWENDGLPKERTA